MMPPELSPDRKVKRWVVVGAIFLVLMITLQFVQPPVRNPLVAHSIQAPEEVLAVLRKGCYDCHSNETKLSWYDKFAPVSWLVSKDVEVARSRFNFSTWDTLSPADQQGRVWEIVNMAIAGKMPLYTYALLHPKSRLSQNDIAILKKYANTLSSANFHDSAIIREAEREFAAFRLVPAPSTRDISASDGVKYIPDYQNWQVISRTNRFDNHSIRVVYGNAIAVKAIREKHINPFPNGSTIVKVVWNSIEEADGEISPGSLNSVQIMTRDKLRFPDTEGWGFAKFNGIKLKPYGERAVFNTTCFNCHKIASENGYVFNIPPDDEVRGARPYQLFDAGGLRVITSFANRKERKMSIVYGNEAALKCALSGYSTHFPGEVFTLVTNKQADNKYWYGSYINGTVERVETVTALAAPGKGYELNYKLAEGDSPVDSLGRPMSAAERIRDILSRRPSVFP